MSSPGGRRGRVSAWRPGTAGPFLLCLTILIPGVPACSAEGSGALSDIASPAADSEVTVPAEGAGTDAEDSDRRTDPPDTGGLDGPADPEDALRIALDAHEARYERAAISLSDALWENRAGSGTSEKVAQARRALLAVFEDPDFLSLLRQWHERRTLTRDPTLSRRVDLWVASGTHAAIELDPGISALADRLVTTLAGHRYTIDGRASDPDRLRSILANDDDAASRRRAWLALLAPGRTLDADIKILNRMRAVKARELRAPDYHRLVYRTDEQDNNWISLIMHTVSRRTRQATRDLFTRLEKAAGKPRLDPWDLSWAMERLSQERGAAVITARHFPEGKEPALAAGILAAMGVRPDSIGMQVSTDGLPGGYEGFPGRIPGGGYRIVTGPRLDPLPAESDYDRVLHLHAHAIQAVFTGAAEPMLKGYDVIPGTRNAIYAEAMAEALAGFLRDPSCLRDVVGMKPDEIAIHLADQRDRRLLSLRRVLLNMAWEQILFINPDAPLDERYRNQFEATYGMPLDPVDPLPWTVEPRFITRPVSWYATLSALGIAADVHHAMRERFGDDLFESVEPGTWWCRTAFATGEAVPMQHRLAETFKAGFDFSRYVESLGATD